MHLLSTIDCWCCWCCCCCSYCCHIFRLSLYLSLCVFISSSLRQNNAENNRHDGIIFLSTKLCFANGRKKWITVPNRILSKCIAKHCISIRASIQCIIRIRNEQNVLFLHFCAYQMCIAFGNVRSILKHQPFRLVHFPKCHTQIVQEMHEILWLFEDVAVIVVNASPAAWLLSPIVYLQFWQCQFVPQNSGILTMVLQTTSSDRLTVRNGNFLLKFYCDYQTKKSMRSLSIVCGPEESPKIELFHEKTLWCIEPAVIPMFQPTHTQTIT